MNRKDRHRPGRLVPIRGVRQARTSAELPQLKKLFKGTGIKLPPVPEAFSERLEERGRWCLSTRMVRLSPYDFDSYVQKARGKRVANYLVIAHAGHGVNSYAWHYYLVDGALRILLQLGWGGVYGDRKKETEEINQCFQLVAKLAATVPDAVRRGRLGKKQRVLVAGSNFYGSFWEKSDEKGLFAQSEIREIMAHRQPVEFLTEILNWLESPAGAWNNKSRVRGRKRGQATLFGVN